MKKAFFRLLDFSYFSYLAVFVGSLLAILVAWQSSLWIENAEKDRFKIAVDQILFLTQKQLQSNVQMVCSSAAFFRASNHVSKEDWKIYIDAHNLEKRFPGVEVVGYASAIPAQKRDAYQEEMRIKGFENFHIFPPLPTDPLFPILYIEPFNAINAKAIGFNIASDPIRKATMEKSLERGLGTLSPKVEFMLDTKSEDRVGFIVYAPVFKKDAIIDSNAQKRENLIGYVFAQPLELKLFLKSFWISAILIFIMKFTMALLWMQNRSCMTQSQSSPTRAMNLFARLICTVESGRLILKPMRFYTFIGANTFLM